MIELAYDEMEASYCSEMSTGLPEEDCILSASLALDAVRQVYFDKSRVLYQLERFISGDRFDEAQTWFGFSVYDALEALIRERRYDQRSFHCIYDQKRMTRRRLHYLETLGLYSPPDFLRRELAELEETALLYRNRLLKLSMYYQKELEERLDNGYRRLKERDLRFHEVLYRELTAAL